VLLWTATAATSGTVGPWGSRQKTGIEVRACLLRFDADEVGNTGVVVALVWLLGHIVEQFVGVTERRSISCVADAAGALSGVESNSTSARTHVDVAAARGGSRRLPAKRRKG
jgi:hypothetical protein